MAPAPGFTIAAFLLVAAVILLATATQRSLSPDPDGGAWLDDTFRLSPRDLYLNVVASQLLVVAAVLAAIWLTAVPWGAIGSVTVSATGAIVTGIGLGAALYLVNATSVRLFDRLGVGYSEALRGALAPSSMAGWAALLLVVLPVIAVAEELLFRAALIGGLEASVGISPWVLVVVSSALFAVGHGIQGVGGVIVTGTLGVVLGVAFVLTSSLLLVIVAHYVVNVLEFVIHEGVETDPIGSLLSRIEGGA